MRAVAASSAAGPSIVASEILNVPDSWYRFGSEGSHSYRVCNACGGVRPTDEEILYGP